LSRARDIPPVSGSIIWARQIERQLLKYLHRVKDILGDQWKSHIDAKELIRESEHFRQKLTSSDVFDQWRRDVESQGDLQLTGRILDIQKRQGSFQLQLQFDERVATLFKEVRNLQWLGFSIPVTILNQAIGAKQSYPFAMSLQETLRSFQQTQTKISPDIQPLLAEIKNNVYQQLSLEGFKLRWDDAKLSRFTRSFADCVTTFRESVDVLLEKNVAIGEQLVQLKSCPLNVTAFSTILEAIQQVVDSLNLASYSNLAHWVTQLDKRVEDLLLQRLEQSLQAWITIFDPKAAAAAAAASSSSSSSSLALASSTTKNQAKVQLPDLGMIVHRIGISNQVVSCDPPIEDARVKWICKLNQWLSIICALPRIKSSRYDEGMHRVQDSAQIASATYRDLV
jgi:dynein heavy chain 1, cytosolic